MCARRGRAASVAGILVPADIVSIVSALACGLRPVTSQNSMLTRSAGENPRLSGPGARGFAAVSRNQLSLIRSGVLGRLAPTVLQASRRRPASCSELRWTQGVVGAFRCHTLQSGAGQRAGRVLVPDGGRRHCPWPRTTMRGFVITEQAAR